MPSKRQATHSESSMPKAIYLNEGISSKKTAFIIVTVVGCIAILWPKVFYPMMFGSLPPAAITSSSKIHYTERQRQSKSQSQSQSHLSSTGGVTCCEVVLNKDEFYNVSIKAMPKSSDDIYGPQLYRKSLNLYTGEISIRQERPAHLHPDVVYQAMRERGRAIPATQTIPIVDRKVASPSTSPSSYSHPPPRIVEGRPGPIPGLRPPMGAGALHQAQPKATSMGIIMPLYTIGIVVFFAYTIMKIVIKKPMPYAPYGPAPSDTDFRKDVFGYENGQKLPDVPLVVTAIQGLIDAADEELKLRESLTCANPKTPNTITMKPPSLSASVSSSPLPSPFQSELPLEAQSEPLINTSTIAIATTTTTTTITTATATVTTTPTTSTTTTTTMIKGNQENASNDHTKPSVSENDRKELNAATSMANAERSVAVLGMEITASCEGGQKWSGRPTTPVLLTQHSHSKFDENELPEPQSIYLEGTVAHDSQILVADKEIKEETVYVSELNGSIDEPAVVLSSKMTLSLINLNDIVEKNRNKPEIDSPLADDIEFIEHDTNE